MAPKGKHLGGRPSKYKPEYCQQIIEYFDIEPYKTITVTFTYKNGDTKDEEKEVANDLPLLSEFARKIGVCHDTLIEWTNVHPEFSEAYKKAKKLQERNWIACSLKGLYSQPFTIFMGKNVFGWADNQNLRLTGADGGPIEQKIVNMPPDFKSIEDWIAWKKSQDGKT